MDISEISDYFGFSLESIFPKCKSEIGELVRALKMISDKSGRIETGEMDALIFKILKCMNVNGVHNLIRKITKQHFTVHPGLMGGIIKQISVGYEPMRKDEISAVLASLVIDHDTLMRLLLTLRIKVPSSNVMDYFIFLLHTVENLNGGVRGGVISDVQTKMVMVVVCVGYAMVKVFDIIQKVKQINNDPISIFDSLSAIYLDIAIVTLVSGILMLIKQKNSVELDALVKNLEVMDAELNVKLGLIRDSLKSDIDSLKNDRELQVRGYIEEYREKKKNWDTIESPYRKRLQEMIDVQKKLDDKIASNDKALVELQNKIKAVKLGKKLSKVPDQFVSAINFINSNNPVQVVQDPNLFGNLFEGFKKIVV